MITFLRVPSKNSGPVSQGDFTLFAILLRADALGAWDLVVSAPWLEREKLESTSELVDLLAESIGKKSLQQFARVVILAADNPTVEFFLKSFPLDDGEIGVSSTDLMRRKDLFGFPIEHAFILRSKRPDPTKATGKVLHLASSGSSRGSK